MKIWNSVYICCPVLRSPLNIFLTSFFNILTGDSLLQRGAIQSRLGQNHSRISGADRIDNQKPDSTRFQPQFETGHAVRVLRIEGSQDGLGHC